MKKTILFRLAATLPVLMFFISSCSKDALTKQEEKQTANAQTAGKGIRGGGSESPGTAQIEAVLMPERAQPAARLFSPDYIGAERFSIRTVISILTDLLKETIQFGSMPGYPAF
jgi:hypothetical protein